jgi:hypothetical protein
MGMAEFKPVFSNDDAPWPKQSSKNGEVDEILVEMDGSPGAPESCGSPGSRKEPPTLPDDVIMKFTEVMFLLYF